MKLSVIFLSVFAAQLASAKTVVKVSKFEHKLRATCLPEKINTVTAWEQKLADSLAKSGGFIVAESSKPQPQPPSVPERKPASPEKPVKKPHKVAIAKYDIKGTVTRFEVCANKISVGVLTEVTEVATGRVIQSFSTDASAKGLKGGPDALTPTVIQDISKKLRSALSSGRQPLRLVSRTKTVAPDYKVTLFKKSAVSK